MPHPPDRIYPRGPNDGPIDPGSVLHRLLAMVAESIVRSKSRTATSETPAPSEGSPNDEGPSMAQSTK